MIKGIVKFYNQEKGFGFITPDDGGADVFVPAATLSNSNVRSLKTGQRVRFEIQPDKKGAKAGCLVIDAENPPEVQPTRPTPIVHYDPSADETGDVLATLNALGEKFLSVDYVATPPSQDQLQRLSVLLRDGSQSLVRRYHPLFLQLSLDDRFIGESEFWTAITEHPQLINGPILALGNRARICKTESEVRSFFGGDSNQKQRSKTMSPRILALINGSNAEPRRESGVVNTPKESARSAPTKATPKEKTKQRVTEKRKEKQTSSPKKKTKAKVAPKGRAQTQKTGRKKK